MLGKSYLAACATVGFSGRAQVHAVRGTVSYEAFTGIQLCQRGDSVRRISPPVLPLTTLSEVGLTSVVFTRRAYAQRSLLPQTDVAHFSFGNLPKKNFSLINIAWEHYSNIAEKEFGLFMTAIWC
jgi:hypothetical protein